MCPASRTEPRLDPMTEGSSDGTQFWVEGRTCATESLEAVLWEHLVVGGRVGDDPLAINPVVLGRGSQVADHLPLFGDHDPAPHLVTQRMAL